MRYIRMPGMLLTTFAEAVNVTNRRNVTGMTYDAGYRTRQPLHSFFATRIVWSAARSVPLMRSAESAGVDGPPRICQAANRAAQIKGCTPGGRGRAGATTARTS